MSTGRTRESGGAARHSRHGAYDRRRGAVAQAGAPEPRGGTLPPGSGLPDRSGEPGAFHDPRREEPPHSHRRRGGPHHRDRGRVSAQRVRRAGRGRGHRRAASPPAHLAADRRRRRGGAGAGASGGHSLRDGPLLDGRPPGTRSLSVRGAVLAGGAARRYGGQPKGLVELGGRRILDRVVDAVVGVTGESPLLVANAADGPTWRPDLRTIPDVRPGRGSLGGIYTAVVSRSEEHTSELQSRGHLVCRLLLEKKKDVKLSALVRMRDIRHPHTPLSDI